MLTAQLTITHSCDFIQFWLRNSPQWPPVWLQLWLEIGCLMLQTKLVCWAVSLILVSNLTMSLNLPSSVTALFNRAWRLHWLLSMSGLGPIEASKSWLFWLICLGRFLIYLNFSCLLTRLIWTLILQVVRHRLRLFWMAADLRSSSTVESYILRRVVIGEIRPRNVSLRHLMEGLGHLTSVSILPFEQ